MRDLQVHPMAWDSTQIGSTECPDHVCDLEGKHVYIRTDRATFARAHVIRETREGFSVRYVEKTDRKTGDPVTKTEFVKRANIRSIRPYRD
jgi:hypothetical protein